MKALRTLSTRAKVMVDQNGTLLGDPVTNTVLGCQEFPPLIRMVYALATNTQSGINNRYLPNKPPEEASPFGMDFSNVIPLGVGIATATLDIFINGAIEPLTPADDEWVKGPVQVQGRMVFANLGGGDHGTDYILRWTAIDTQDFWWPRVGLILVTRTS